jgi:hypothetical protein
MIKQKITYEDFEGRMVTEDYYFHLSKNELIQMESSPEGSLSDKLTAIQSRMNGAEIIKAFGEIVGKAYGIREGASGFRKSEEASEEFLRSLAYDQLLGDLISEPDMAAKFVNGLFPKDLLELAEKVGVSVEARGGTIRHIEKPELSVGALPDSESGLKSPRGSQNQLLPWAFRTPTHKELTTMTKGQLLDVMNRQTKGWVPPPTVS